jgi:hypothetical protein
VPNNVDFQRLTPWRATSELEQEIVHNLYDGLFNPKVKDRDVDRGYGAGLADFDFSSFTGQVQSSGRPVVTLDLVASDRHWYTSGEPSSPNEKVTAHDVVGAWRQIESDNLYPGRNRFTSVIQSIEAVDSDTIRVVFRTQVEWATRAREALGFRIFRVQDLRSRVPVSSGPYLLDFPPTAERQREFLPSPNEANSEERPRLIFRPVPSARSRLDLVVKGEAQVALSIPPYYIGDIGGAGFAPMNQYNIWALVFSSRLTTSQRRFLASSLDVGRLLDAFLRIGHQGEAYLDLIEFRKFKLLSPSIFPANFEVFECARNQERQGRLPADLGEVAGWIENPDSFGHPFTDPPRPLLPDPFHIAYREGGVFEEGVGELIDEISRQLDGNDYVGRLRVTPVSSEGDWQEVIARLTNGSSSEYNAALVRFEYDRRCDVSIHFKDHRPPSLELGGLFHWITNTPEGRALQWSAGDLATLRDTGYCDAAVAPALRVVRAVHDLAPAKFLFTVPSLIVYDPRLTVGVNDEFVLAGIKNWRYVGQPR